MVPLSAELPELQLGKESLDLILMVMVYHDIYYKSDFCTPPNRDDTAAQNLHRIDDPRMKTSIGSIRVGADQNRSVVDF